MGAMKRVAVALSPSMEIALRYLAAKEDAQQGTIARRILRTGLDRTINSAEVKALIAQHRSAMNAREWAAMQLEAAEELTSATRGGADSSSDAAPG